MTIARDYEAPDGFATELMVALRPRTHVEPSLADVDRYVDVLRQSGLESRLLWIEPWLPDEIGYRSGVLICTESSPTKGSQLFDHWEYDVQNRRWIPNQL